MSREEELKIIERIRDGEETLYESLILAHSPKILSVVRSVVGNNEDAEEIAQDVFVKAYFSLDKFRGDSSFSTWLFRIAYNMAISKVRKKRISYLEIDKAGVITSEVFSQDDTEALEKEKRFQILEKLLNTLDAKERFLIILFYNQEKSIKEISAITGMGESNVKVSLHRIKKRLAESAGSKMEVSYG
jgi:RNA polymerase sigma-70 factor (ECF subfamily)